MISIHKYFLLCCIYYITSHISMISSVNDLRVNRNYNNNDKMSYNCTDNRIIHTSSVSRYSWLTQIRTLFKMFTFSSIMVYRRIGTTLDNDPGSFLLTNIPYTCRVRYEWIQIFNILWHSSLNIIYGACAIIFFVSENIHRSIWFTTRHFVL